MGIFGGSLFGNTEEDSSSRSYNSQSSESNTLGQQGISGVGTVGTGNRVTVTTTDHGAVAGGLTIANNALKANQNVTGAAFDFADAQNARSQYTMLQSLFGAFSFGRDALDAERAAQSESHNLALEALHVGTAASSAALDKYTDEVNHLVQQTSTNNDERIADLGKYALLAAVIMGVAPMFFGRRK